MRALLALALLLSLTGCAELLASLELPQGLPLPPAGSGGEATAGGAVPACAGANRWGPGCANDCQINAACREGGPWANEANAVVWHNGPHRVSDPLSSSPNQEAWTAFFVNNAAGDGHPYLLTARHVMAVSGPSYTYPYQTYLRFNYRAADCAGARLPSYHVAQARFKVVAQGPSGVGTLDYALLSLETPIPRGARVYYAGWTLDETPPASGAHLGHPRADLLKIALVESFARLRDTRSGRHRWRMNTVRGGSEVGQSGAPIFGADRLVRGILTSGMGCAQAGRSFQNFGAMLSEVWSYDYRLDHENRATTYTLRHHLGKDRNVRSVRPLAGYGFDLRDETFADPATDYAGGFFRTLDGITASGVTVAPGGRLELRARQSIQIEGPFRAEAGGSFVAAIEPAPTPSAAPTPLAHETRFRFTLPHDGRVRLTAYDADREVAVLMDEWLEAGHITLSWFGYDAGGALLAEGAYRYRLDAGAHTETGPLVVAR